MKNTLTLIIILTTVLTTAFTCKSPSEPEDKPTIPDTTSHNFTWRVDTIGYYQSIVRDVAVINENNIWAVGRFHKKHSTQDSTENDRYGLAKWNGIKWQLQKMHFVYNGVPDLSSSVEPDAIWVISENEIWMATGRTPIRIKNGNWENFNLSSITTDRDIINKIWAKDGNNVYFVGNKGTIIYYDGTTFTKLNYTADVDFLDVWGDESGVVRAVSKGQTGKEIPRLIRIKNNLISIEYLGQETVKDNGLPDWLLSVWWNNVSETNYWIASDNGLYKYEASKFNKVINNYEYSYIATLRIRGNAENDIFFSGVEGQLIHYNGNTIHRYAELFKHLLRYWSLSIKNNTVCAGGYYFIGDNSSDVTTAVVAIGKRN